MTMRRVRAQELLRWLWAVAICLGACRGGPKQPAKPPMFELLTPNTTGVTFVNRLPEDSSFNFISYPYYYNGGGVAVGDVNNDGLPDLYFSSSRFSNKLYLNRGNFQFIDVTDVSGVGAQQGFKTGVAMIDINGDGKLDIYSCRTSKTDDGL